MSQPTSSEGPKDLKQEKTSETKVTSKSKSDSRMQGKPKICLDLQIVMWT